MISLSAAGPPYFRAGRFVLRADDRAIDKHHAERAPALLHQVEQPLPDTPLGPADEHQRMNTSG
jgi:hypothetical protein